MHTKEIMHDLYLKMAACNSVKELMDLFEKTERDNGVVSTFMFVANTPSEADMPQYLSLVDENGEEWSNTEVNRAAVAFAIRTNMTYDHRDLCLAHAEWINPQSQHMSTFMRALEDNDADVVNSAKMLDVLTRVTPSLEVVK